jgi:hypothetical protein
MSQETESQGIEIKIDQTNPGKTGDDDGFSNFFYS